MKNYDTLKEKFIISTDKSKLDIAVIHKYLSIESYWAKNIPVVLVQKSIEESFCFGVYRKDNLNKNEQIGFARVITDKATFGYLADVFILEEYRGIGLSKWLMQAIMDHQELQGFRRWMLATRDAHKLYEQFGFAALDKPERIMQMTVTDAYL